MVEITPSWCNLIGFLVIKLKAITKSKNKKEKCDTFYTHSDRQNKHWNE